jgi:hypothetical protein
VEARFSRFVSDYQWAFSLQKTDALSDEEFDKISGDRAESAASVRVAKASMETAKLNLEFT